MNAVYVEKEWIILDITVNINNASSRTLIDIGKKGNFIERSTGAWVFCNVHILKMCNFVRGKISFSFTVGIVGSFFLEFSLFTWLNLSNIIGMHSISRKKSLPLVEK